MRFQFSLATLLICTTVLAVVSAWCVQLPVREERIIEIASHLFPEPIHVVRSRRPTAQEIARRLAIWGPISVVGTLAGLWIVRRLKSRREIGPPIG
jgi:hypothetical protein